MKKFISKITLLALGFVFTETSTAQSSFTLDASQLSTSFRFTDSTGTKENKDYHSIMTGAYSIGYRYESNEGLLLAPRIGMRKAGATLVYDDANYSWNFQYMDIKVGIGYILKKERFSPYLMVAPYYGILLKATQTMNNVNYDIKASKAIQSSDFGVFINPGLEFKANDMFSAYAEFTYMLGLKNLEKDSNQKSYNKAMGLTLGVAFKISKD